MLFVIEGLDGSGKSTQVRMMKDYLRTVPQKLEYIHFPRYDAPVYGELIGKFLRGGFGRLEDVHPQLVALLYAEDRHGAAADIREVLAQGGNVLLDRYVYSNVAYQCAKLSSREEREALREWILTTEYDLFGEPRPDLNIFLDVPAGFVESRLKGSRSGADRSYLEGNKDIHEADMDFQRRVREVYLRCCETDPSFLRIDCAAPDESMLPPDKIFRKIRAAIDKALAL